MENDDRPAAARRAQAVDHQTSSLATADDVNPRFRDRLPALSVPEPEFASLASQTRPRTQDRYDETVSYYGQDAGSPSHAVLTPSSWPGQALHPHHHLEPRVAYTYEEEYSYAELGPYAHQGAHQAYQPHRAYSYEGGHAQPTTIPPGWMALDHHDNVRHSPYQHADVQMAYPTPMLPVAGPSEGSSREDSVRSASDRHHSATPPASPGRERPPPTVTPFISKLARLLDTPDYSNFIRWNNDGTAFTFAHKSKELLEVFSKLFRHNKLASFIRQLNIYGFIRLSQAEVLRTTEHSPRSTETEWTGFWHPAFFRAAGGRPCDLSVIKPKSSKPLPASRRKTTDGNAIPPTEHAGGLHAAPSGLPIPAASARWQGAEYVDERAVQSQDPYWQHQLGYYQQQQLQYSATASLGGSHFEAQQHQPLHHQQQQQQQQHQQPQGRPAYHPYPPQVMRRGHSSQ
ncbi:hypothetical protein ACM66B_001053 [Microbotryomycetes sp. NB124-2]